MTDKAKPNRKEVKKCIKCRQWKRRRPLVVDGEVVEPKGFGQNDDSADGLQSICYKCKSKMNIASRNRNVVARIRHHTGTRCLTQLGDSAPNNLVANLEQYLGYKIRKLVKHLGQDLKEREGPTRKLVHALNDGYHIDHIRPLSSYRVVVNGQVQWDVFRECWAIENLSAIPAQENLQKGAKMVSNG